MTDQEPTAGAMAIVDQVRALAHDLMGLSVCGYDHQLAGNEAEADVYLSQIIIRLRTCSDDELFLLAGILLPYIGALLHDLRTARP
jgi:hypothetical protein